MLPYLKEYDRKTKKQIIHIGGLNFTDAPREGELTDSKGLTSARFPVLSTRGARKEIGNYVAPTAIFAWGKQVVVDGTNFYYDGNLIGQVLSGEKQFAVVNTKLVIWPDKVYFDLNDLQIHSMTALARGGLGFTYSDNLTATNGTDFTNNTLTIQVPRAGSRVASQKLVYISPTSTSGVAFYILTYDSISWNPDGTIASTPTVTSLDNLVAGKYVVPKVDNTVQVVFRGITEPPPSVSQFTDPLNTNRIYGIVDCCGKYYLTMDGGELTAACTRITQISYYAGTPNVFELDDIFSPGDAVSITGCETYTANNKSAVITSVSGNVITFAPGTFTGVGTELGEVVIEKNVPNLDFICEWNNRLWGVSNSTQNIIHDENGERTVNARVIYASALGDPTNFNVFEGLSTDSFQVAVGTEGDFTGICGYSDSVLFWKEDYLHKIVGSMPSDYYLYTYNVTGLQAGSHKSLRIINEVLYFKGRNGIYAYAGGVPELISDCFGTRRYTKAIAGADGFLYYVSMQDSAGAWHMFVYDTQNHIWMREDNTHALDFACLNGVLYFISGTKIYAINDGSEVIEWSAEFAPFNETTLGRKYYSKLYLRVELSAGAWMQAEIRYDTGPWRKVWTESNANTRTITIPIPPIRCDSFQVRLSGKGGCVVSSMVREFMIGSEA